MIRSCLSFGDWKATRHLILARSLSVSCAWLGTAALGAAPSLAQEERVRGHRELEALLWEHAGIAATMPDLGYSWNEEDIAGTRSRGSIWVTHTKMIYYFVHWGPMEAESITEDYVRRRIPEIWPSEGLRVMATRPMTVAGHPAIYAEAIPRREFYRAHFLIWNCPESGRQFIADMNYNVRYLTPRSALQAQIDATTNTLSCHDGAPTTTLPDHVARYDSPRFRLAFAHPLRWHVFESPYRVPHPAYQGVRDETIGSVLAWLKDREVHIGFAWQPTPSVQPGDTSAMVGDISKFRAALDLMETVEGLASFTPQASETLTIHGRAVLKVLGKVTGPHPDTRPSASIPEGRATVLVLDISDARQLLVIVRIDNYTLDGVSLPPDRDIFDRLARDVLSGLEPNPGSEGRSDARGGSR